MSRAVLSARAGGSRIAAHPSYEDREHFGRVSLDVAPDALTEWIRRQCAQLREIAGDVRFAKPHGALYHDAGRDPARARALLDGIDAALGKVGIIGPPGLQALAEERGFAFFHEGFADRRYAADGTLMPRSEPGAVITNPVDASVQARVLLASERFRALCVHGDNPAGLEIARAVRDVLLE